MLAGKFTKMKPIKTIESEHDGYQGAIVARTHTAGWNSSSKNRYHKNSKQHLGAAGRGAYGPHTK